MKTHNKFFTSLLTAVFFLSVYTIFAQERARTVTQPASPQPTTQEQPEDIVRVNTRVVFINALVRDRRTGLPVKDLGRDDFQVLDNGKLRNLTYFSREGNKRQPLALTLVVDGCTGFRNVWLEKAASIMERFASTLKRLPPEDEVAVLWTRCGDFPNPCSPRIVGSGEVQPLTFLQDLTYDRAALSTALLRVPSLAKQMNEEERYYQSIKRKETRTFEQIASGIARVPDKSIQLASDRPASQAMILFVTDDVGLVRLADRNIMAEKLTRAGVPVYALVTSKSFFINLGVGEFGVGSPDNRRANRVQFLAKETGGEAVRVSDPDKYADAFERIIGDITARYSLGFTLEEGEADDGRFHQLEVKVKPPDAHGKARKLSVIARRGYYMQQVKSD